MINNISPAKPADTLPVIWGSNPPQNPLFFTRKLSNEIKSKMQNKNSTLVLVAMSGLGGVGKTELAKDYFYHPDKIYTAKLWFNANSREHLEAEYRLLAKELHLVEEESDIHFIVRKVHAFLAKHPGWLMVLDNADAAAEIQSLLPTQGGDILITSRQPTWQGEIFAVDVLEELEAIRFYQKLSGKQDNEDSINELVKRLGFLPLAIAQAVAYIKAEPCSIEKYLDDFNQYKQYILETNSLLPATTNAEQARLTIMTTWNLSLDAIERKHPTTEDKPFCARELLICCAYLDCHNIPRTLLEKWVQEQYPNKEPKFILRDAIIQLHSHSLIQRSEQFVAVHNLLQEVIRIQNPLTNNRFITLVNILRQDVTVKNTSMKELIRTTSLLSHFEAVLDHYDKSFKEKVILSVEPFLVLLLAHMGQLYDNRGMASSALKFWQRVLKATETRYGPTHWKLADPLNSLGNTYGELGMYKEKRDNLERALKIAESCNTSMHTKIAIILNNLANAYGALGNHQQKRKYLQRALKITEDNYDPVYINVAPILCNLGNVYSDLGLYSLALESLVRAQNITKTHYESKHLEQSKILNSLGKVYGELKQHQLQLECYQCALKIQEDYYGPMHVQVAMILNNLGKAHGDLGQYNETQKCCERALNIIENYYDPEHVMVAKSLNNLGNLYGVLRQHERQREYLERALKINQKHYGPKHVEVAFTLDLLGNAHGALQEYIPALKCFHRALKIAKNHFGSRQHTCLAQILIHISSTYGELGLDKEAQIYFEHATKIKTSDSLSPTISPSVTVASVNHFSSIPVNTAMTPYADLAKQIDFDKNIKKGFILNEYGTKDVTLAFRKAAEKGNLKHVKFLFSLSININATDAVTKKTALHWAVANNHIEVVRFLIENGAKLDITDAAGKHASDYATHQTIRGYLQSKKACSRIQNNSKTTPIMFF